MATSSSGGQPESAFKEIDYFLCYADRGKAQDVAVRAKEWFADQGMSVWDRKSEATITTTKNDDDDGERKRNCVVACRIFVSKAVLLFIDFEWLDSPLCVFDYNLAQLQNLTSSRPVIFPIFCEDLSCCTDEKSIAVIDAVKHDLPPVQVWNKEDEVEETEIFRLINFKLGSILLKHMPDLPKLPEFANQEARRACRASAVMAGLTRDPAAAVTPLASGKWVGVVVGAGRSRIGGQRGGAASERYPLDCLLRVRPDAESVGVDDVFHGHGRDDAGLFRIEGSRKGTKIRFQLTYPELEKSQTLPSTIHFEGVSRGCWLSGKWRLEDGGKSFHGYWALWPERVDDNQGWNEFVRFFRTASRQSTLSSPRAIGVVSTTTPPPPRKPLTSLNRRATEELASSAAEAKPSVAAILRGSKTSSVENVREMESKNARETETKRVKFAEDEENKKTTTTTTTTTTFNKTPSSPSFGVRLTFNTENLAGAASTGAASNSAASSFSSSQAASSIGASTTPTIVEPKLAPVAPSRKQKTTASSSDIKPAMLNDQEAAKMAASLEITRTEVSTSSAAASTGVSLTQKPPSPPTPERLGLVVAEKSIPIERRRSKDRSPIVVVKESSPMHMSPRDSAPLVIREAPPDFRPGRSASPIDIRRQRSPGRITEIPVVTVRTTENASVASAADFAADSAADFAGPIVESPVSPVVTVPILKEMPIVAAAAAAGAAAGDDVDAADNNNDYRGGSKKKRKSRRERKESREAASAAEPADARAMSASREGNVSIPVVRQGDETKTKPAANAAGVAAGVAAGTAADALRPRKSRDAVVIPVVRTEIKSEDAGRADPPPTDAASFKTTPGPKKSAAPPLFSQLGAGFSDDDFFSSSSLSGADFPAFSSGCPIRLGPDASSETVGRSDSMSFEDASDGSSTRVESESRSSRTSRSDRSVDADGGASTEGSSFFVSSFSSSSSSTMLNDGDARTRQFGIGNRFNDAA